MKRTPIVLTGTALGLAGVLGYHTVPASSGLVGGSAAVAAATSPASNSSTTSHRSGTTSTSQVSTQKQSATGQDVSYQYGDVEIKVTKSGGRITGVSVVRLGVGDPRSESIDQYAIPQLEQQTLTAQSAKIDGVSGASYTSQAYEQSLQSALDKLAS